MIRPPRDNKKAGKGLGRAAGFTLLELLVVLSIIGMMSAFVLPNLPGYYDAFQLRFHRDDMVSQLGGLSFRMLRANKDGVLASQPGGGGPDFVGEAILMELPSGWSLEVDPPIHFRHDGVCTGGEVVLVYGQASLRLELEPPLCRISRSE